MLLPRRLEICPSSSLSTNLNHCANINCSLSSARDSKPLEVIGTFNPVPQRPTGLSDEEARAARAYKDISLDRSRAKYWLGVGAQPSDGVWRLLHLVCPFSGEGFSRRRTDGHDKENHLFTDFECAPRPVSLKRRRFPATKLNERVYIVP